MGPSLRHATSRVCSEVWHDFKNTFHHHHQPSCQGISPEEPFGFDQLGRRWGFDLTANKIRTVMPRDSARHGKVNVSSLGQRKRGLNLELDLSNRSGAGSREMNSAVGNGVGVMSGPVLSSMMIINDR